MGMTRSAARLGFVVLLVGAGAAAVAARPLNMEAHRRLEVVTGDPRLDMAWALAQRGMATGDAARVSVLLVDRLDVRGELQPITNAWAAELWWQTETADAAPMTRMIRVLLNFDLGKVLHRAVAAQECDGDRSPFIAMKSMGTSELPIPRDTLVLVRLFETWPSGCDHAIGAGAFAPIGATAHVECLPVSVDLDHGVAAPLRWPSK